MSVPPRMIPPSPEAIERVRQLAERRMSAEEFEAYVHAPMTEAERQEILESVAWFTKRYPTPAERLAAARHAYKQWAQGMPCPRRTRNSAE
jgi:hypothetical protein